jgi:methionyl aminopeptidase
MIEERGQPTVFELIGKKPVRSIFTKEVLKQLNSLPFTTRWLTKSIHPSKVNFALKELKQLGILREYPPLVDKNNGLVSQAEHTVIVKDKPIVTTLI